MLLQAVNGGREKERERGRHTVSVNGRNRSYAAAGVIVDLGKKRKKGLLQLFSIIRARGQSGHTAQSAQIVGFFGTGSPLSILTNFFFSIVFFWD